MKEIPEEKETLLQAEKEKLDFIAQYNEKKKSTQIVDILTAI